MRETKFRGAAVGLNVLPVYNPSSLRFGREPLPILPLNIKEGQFLQQSCAPGWGIAHLPSKGPERPDPCPPTLLLQYSGAPPETSEPRRDCLPARTPCRVSAPLHIPFSRDITTCAPVELIHSNFGEARSHE